MFGIKKGSGVVTGDMNTIIGKDTVFKGTVTGKGTIRVDGQFEGELQTTGDLMVGDTAVITANVKARNAVIGGTIHGNVEIAEKMELLSTAKIYGDIKVGVLIIGEGAVFKGACEMKHLVEPQQQKSNK